MPDLTLTFPTKLNVSVAVGDTAYYVATQNSADSSGFTINNGEVYVSRTYYSTDWPETYNGSSKIGSEIIINNYGKL